MVIHVLLMMSCHMLKSCFLGKLRFKFVVFLFLGGFNISFLGCGAVPQSAWHFMFGDNVLISSLGVEMSVKNLLCSWTFWPLNIRLQTSGTNHPVTQWKIPEELVPQLHCCENLKTCTGFNILCLFLLVECLLLQNIISQSWTNEMQLTYRWSHTVSRDCHEILGPYKCL
jgi:hypothetical protein